MDELTQGILIGLIPAIVVSILTSYITVNLSLKQFYSQRWWDKKEAEYTQIMHELACLKLCFRDWYGSLFYNKEMMEQDSEKLNETYKKARVSLARISAMGTFVISKETVTALDDLLTQFNQEAPRGDPFAALESDYKTVEQCIIKVQECAQKDLQKK
jgi:nitrogen fixation/metabolism regulation signal transduction histidine kinase